MAEYIVRMPPDMPYEIQAELNAWYIESEPIVRCKDCKYHEGLMGGVCTLWGFLVGRQVFTRSHGFCSWGERKEEQITDIPERTCRLERHGSLANYPEMVCWSCSECHFGWHHDVNDKQFSYCPNCGAKVVNE